MIELNHYQVSDLLDQAVQDKGADYIYPQVSEGNGPRCVYVHVVEGDAERRPIGVGADEYNKEPLEGLTLAPGCLIGYVLHQAGVPLEEMAFCGGGVDSLLKELSKREILHVSNRGRRLLTKAQTHQDHKVPWGLAVRLAKEYDEGWRIGYDVAVRTLAHDRPRGQGE